MTLFIQTTDFKKIAQCEFENFYASYIDFDQQEWQFIQRPNEENDVGKPVRKGQPLFRVVPDEKLEVEDPVARAKRIRANTDVYLQKLV